MPIFTTPISTQNQAGSGGSYFYPQIMQVKQFSIVGDQMQRDAVTPTGAVQLYSTVSGAGTPTLTMLAQKELELTTTAAANDSAATRTQAFSFNRNIFPQLDNRTILNIDIFFTLRGVATSRQDFIGIIDSGTNLAALPTTARHLGVYLDTSVSGNFKLSSSDGTTQSTTDTTVAAVISTFYRLNIQWTGDDAAVLTFYTGTFPNLSTVQKTQTVTALQGNNRALEFHFFTLALTTSARILGINSWSVASS